jgi:hypothetical protein
MRIREPKPALAATKPNFYAYGLGFQLRDYKGRKIAMHGGALQGFYSTVLMVPEEKLGIAILTNAENSPAMASLYYRILDQYLKVPPTDWIKLYADQEAAMHKEELERQGKEHGARGRFEPSLPLAAYDGEYEDAWYGKVSIREEGGKHVMRFERTPDLSGELEHFQHDTFIVRWKERNFNADAYVTFALNPDGSIERMKMAPISTETDFSYDFRDLNFTPPCRPRTHAVRPHCGSPVGRRLGGASTRLRPCAWRCTAPGRPRAADVQRGCGPAALATPKLAVTGCAAVGQRRSARRRSPCAAAPPARTPAWCSAPASPQTPRRRGVPGFRRRAALRAPVPPRASAPGRPPHGHRNR